MIIIETITCTYSVFIAEKYINRINRIISTYITLNIVDLIILDRKNLHLYHIKCCKYI